MRFRFLYVGPSGSQTEVASLDDLRALIENGTVGEVTPLFDVLTQQTPWREPLGCKEAVEEVRRCAGAQFDPQVVEAFCLVQPLIQPVGQRP